MKRLFSNLIFQWLRYMNEFRGAKAFNERVRTRHVAKLFDLAALEKQLLICDEPNHLNVLEARWNWLLLRNSKSIGHSNVKKATTWGPSKGDGKLGLLVKVWLTC